MISDGMKWKWVDCAKEMGGLCKGNGWTVQGRQQVVIKSQEWQPREKK